ncbi:hypothetical protein D5275_01505 [Adlercreutzia muris]|nr:hypothetical protein [Adlercreutzia muris]
MRMFTRDRATAMIGVIVRGGAFPGAPRQGCAVHFCRSALAKVSSLRGTRRRPSASATAPRGADALGRGVGIFVDRRSMFMLVTACLECVVGGE